jgi:hypothetical protein
MTWQDVKRLQLSPGDKGRHVAWTVPALLVNR